MTTTHGAAYDEDDRGGPRHHGNYISVIRASDLYKATEKVLLWETPGAHEQEDRRIIPGVYFEALFAKAPVPNPDALTPERFLTKCLNLHGYLVPNLDKLIAGGLLTELDADGEEVNTIFQDINEFYSKASGILKSLIDDKSLEIGPEALEWLEEFADDQAAASHAWLYALDMGMLTRRTNTLELYIDLNFAVGPRSTKAIRVESGSTFETMVGTQGGGQLGQAIKSYYYRHLEGQAVTPAFLLRRLVDFLHESTWPEIYKHDYWRWEDYAFDLPNRALWHTATRQEWAAIVQGKIIRTLRRDLPTLCELFRDYLEQPGKVIREIQALADALLAESLAKLPFYNLERLESTLTKEYGEMIEESLQDTLEKHHQQLKQN